MTRTIFFLLFFLAAVVTSHAQLPDVPKESLPSSANPSGLVTQLTNAIEPTSFTDSWGAGKQGFLGKAQSISNAAGMASTISSLVGYIKPSLFKTSTTASGILSAAGKVQTMTQAASLLKNFEGSLKPEAFVSGWAGQRGGWLSALNLLK